MKNLTINTKEVKRLLDAAVWNYEYCSSTPGSDIERALSYLDSQKFSLKNIEEELKGYRLSDIIEIDDCDNINECVANFLADTLAEKRIRRYVYSSLNKNGWHVDEGVTFKIN